MRYTLALIVALTLTALQALAFSSVRVQVLNRGQAHGIVIRTPNSQWVVIDAGTNGQQADYMAEMGIETVALAVISHRHFDHHGGMDEVLRDLTVERLAAVMEDCPNRTSDDRWRNQVGDEVERLAQGTSVTIDGVLFEILPASPTMAECPDEENDNSLVVRMSLGEFSMLFTGDAEVDRLKRRVRFSSDFRIVHVGSRRGESRFGSTDRSVTVGYVDRAASVRCLSHGFSGESLGLHAVGRTLGRQFRCARDDGARIPSAHGLAIRDGEKVTHDLNALRDQ